MVTTLKLKAILFGMLFFACASCAQNQSEPEKKHYDSSLVKGSFVVAPREFTNSVFSVPSRCSGVRMDGRFTASGGAFNDIEVYLLDEDGYVNFKNHNQASTYYNSGRVTQATVDVALPDRAGSYYLVFNNRFSFLSNKAITADISLHFVCSK